MYLAMELFKKSLEHCKMIGKMPLLDITYLFLSSLYLGYSISLTFTLLLFATTHFLDPGPYCYNFYLHILIMQPKKGETLSLLKNRLTWWHNADWNKPDIERRLSIMSLTYRSLKSLFNLLKKSAAQWIKYAGSSFITIVFFIFLSS